METDEDFKSTGNHAMLEESISKITSIASQISLELKDLLFWI